MSEIDPMVHDLMEATRERQSYDDHGEGESERALFWEGKEDYLARQLTARLAQPTVTREQIRDAINSCPYYSGSDLYLDDFTDAIMAVIAPDTEGGE